MTYLGSHTKKFRVIKPKNLNVNTSLYNQSLFNIKNKFMFSVRKHHTYTINQLGYYIAGLIEGDGSIILRKGEREKISASSLLLSSELARIL